MDWIPCGRDSHRLRVRRGFRAAGPRAARFPPASAAANPALIAASVRPDWARIFPQRVVPTRVLLSRSRLGCRRSVRARGDPLQVTDQKAGQWWKRVERGAPSRPGRRIESRKEGRKHREAHLAVWTRCANRLSRRPNHKQRQDDIPDIVVTADAPRQEKRIYSDQERRAQATQACEPSAERKGRKYPEHSNDHRDQKRTGLQRIGRFETR
jgi:hypothetical protein